LDYARELPPGQVALRKVSPGEHPDFAAALAGAANLDALRAAIGHSLDYLSRPSSRAAYPYLDVTHDRAVATLVALRQVLDDAALRADPARLNAVMAERFDVYQSIGAPAADNSHYTGKVLFTGYFTARAPPPCAWRRDDASRRRLSGARHDETVGMNRRGQLAPQPHP